MMPPSIDKPSTCVTLCGFQSLPFLTKLTKLAKLIPGCDASHASLIHLPSFQLVMSAFLSFQPIMSAFLSSVTSSAAESHSHVDASSICLSSLEFSVSAKFHFRPGLDIDSPLNLCNSIRTRSAPNPTFDRRVTVAVAPIVSLGYLPTCMYLTGRGTGRR